MDVKSEIIRRLEALPPETQQRLLDHLERFEHARPPGEAGSALLPFAGVLDDESAREMTLAIEAGCEAVDTREW